MNKKYCFTDVHGRYNLWKQIRDYCDDTDIIYFLGDACDRGPDGLKIIKELLLDKRVIYLKGNHEEIFVRCGESLIERYTGDTHLWISNGGKDTIKDFLKLSYESQLWFIKKLNKLPVSDTIVNKNNQIILLSHAGSNPDKKFLSESDYLWDRDHIMKPFPEKKEYQNMYVVHGHTPVPYVAWDLKIPIDIGKDESCNILKYSNNHKIDLDLMSFESKKIALFDLDTLEVEKYFYE